MNICIHSNYTCTFDDFMAQVEKTRPQWSAFVDKHNIAKVDDNISIMIMKVNDFEAMDKISAVREKAAEHFAMTLNSAHAGACLSS